MVIIVGYTPTPAGEAAIDHAVAEAHHHGDDLLVVNVSGHSDPPKETFATDTEIKDLEDRLHAEGLRFTSVSWSAAALRPRRSSPSRRTSTCGASSSASGTAPRSAS